MGLFTNPVTFTVNAVARIFGYRGQLSDPKGEALIGDWYEPAAAVSSQSRFEVKHRVRGTLVQSAIIRKVMLPILDGTLKPATVTMSAVFHVEHTAAQQDVELELMNQATASQGFRDGFTQRLIGP